MEAGFPRCSRLLTKADFDRVFQRPKRLATPFFTVLYCSNHHELARLGVIISKKNVPRAVDRNRLRRRIRETFRLTRPLLPGIDIVVIARRGAHKIDNTEILNRLDELWRRLRHG